MQKNSNLTQKSKIKLTQSSINPILGFINGRIQAISELLKSFKSGKYSTWEDLGSALDQVLSERGEQGVKNLWNHINKVNKIDDSGDPVNYEKMQSMHSAKWRKKLLEQQMQAQEDLQQKLKQQKLEQEIVSQKQMICKINTSKKEFVYLIKMYIDGDKQLYQCAVCFIREKQFKAIVNHLNNEHSYNQESDKWRELKDIWWNQKVTEFKTIKDDQNRSDQQKLLSDMANIDPVIRQTLDRIRANKKDFVYLIKSKIQNEVQMFQCAICFIKEKQFNKIVVHLNNDHHYSQDVKNYTELRNIWLSQKLVEYQHLDNDSILKLVETNIFDEQFKIDRSPTAQFKCRMCVPYETTNNIQLIEHFEDKHFIKSTEPLQMTIKMDRQRKEIAMQKFIPRFISDKLTDKENAKYDEIWQKYPKFAKMVPKTSFMLQFYKMFFNHENPNSSEIPDQYLTPEEKEIYGYSEKDKYGRNMIYNADNEFIVKVIIVRVLTWTLGKTRANNHSQLSKRHQKDFLVKSSVNSYIRKIKIQFLNALRHGLDVKCKYQSCGISNAENIIQYQCNRCFQYIETLNNVKAHIYYFHRHEQHSSKIEENEQKNNRDQLKQSQIYMLQKYNFLQTYKYGNWTCTDGSIFLCMLGCAPSSNNIKSQLLNKNQLRKHYIDNHTFEDMKLWGYNVELLKLENNLPNRYQEDFVDQFDLMDVYKGIKYNEQQYRQKKQINDLGTPNEESIIADITKRGSTIFDTKEQARDKESMFEMMLDIGPGDKRESSYSQNRDNYEEQEEETQLQVDQPLSRDAHATPEPQPPKPEAPVSAIEMSDFNKDKEMTADQQFENEMSMLPENQGRVSSGEWDNSNLNQLNMTDVDGGSMSNTYQFQKYGKDDTNNFVNVLNQK